MTMAKEAVDYSSYSPVDLLKMEVRTERQEEIPVDSIVQESALIDPQHAQNLAESMMGNRKQISPTTVRARLDGERVVYDNIDGFHRTEGKRIIEQLINEPQTLKTIVLYGCGDEELFDLRVLAASSVKSIKFARMAEWMKRSFFSTHWQNNRIYELVEKEEITLSQVFNLAQFDSSGKNLGLKPEEVIELKEWAGKKSKQWGRPLSTLMVEMRTVELAAPDLVQRVRTGGGGSGGRGILTRARLEAIVTNLPGDWELQRQMVNLAISKNILAQDLDFLAWSYAQAREASDQSTMTKILTQPELLLNPQPVVVQEDTPEDLSQLPYSRSPLRKNYHEKVFLPSVEVKKPTMPVDENKILRKYQIPEIINLLMETILADKGKDLTILYLPKGPITLNLKSGIMKHNEQTVQLTDRETKLMTIFSLLEGTIISDKLLVLIVPAGSRTRLRGAVVSLKQKMAELSLEASWELRLDRKSRYRWLKE